jgi:hypothetical protein
MIDDESDWVSPMQTNYIIYTIHAKLTLVLTNDLVLHLFNDFTFAR